MAARRRHHSVVSEMSAPELVQTGAAELAGLIASRRVSATEAVRAHIERIQALEGRLNAVVTPLFEQAVAEAAEADRGRAEGRPLHGVPVTVKECFHMQGTPSTLGLDAKRGAIAEDNADLVTRLRDAGAIVVAKTNVPQLLLYIESDNPLYGRTNNPWDLARTPGGSSGGEGAAVAAGYGSLGLGTDIGGSVRIPAHFCGVHSLKPTPDRLSLRGTEDESFFSPYAVPDGAGPLARSVDDLRLAMAVLGSPIAERPVKDLRIGVYDDDGYIPSSPAIKRAIRAAASALETMGCRVQEFAPPDVYEALAVFYGLFTVDGGDSPKAWTRGSTVDPRIKDLLTLAGLSGALRQPVSALYRFRGQRRVGQLVGWAGRRSEAAIAELVARRDAYRRRFDQTMADLDVLICPPCSLPAFTHGATKDLGPASICYTLPFNLLAWPAGVVAATRVKPGEEGGRPAGRDLVDETARKVDLGSAGLPVGVQVAARSGRDDHVVAVMAALEQHFRDQADYPVTSFRIETK